MNRLDGRLDARGMPKNAEVSAGWDLVHLVRFIYTWIRNADANDIIPVASSLSVSLVRTKQNGNRACSDGELWEWIQLLPKMCGGADKVWPSATPMGLPFLVVSYNVLR